MKTWGRFCENRTGPTFHFISVSVYLSVENGDPIPFSVQETDDVDSLYFLINDIERKIVVYDGQPESPGGKDRVVYQTPLTH